ncbi:hypothetical protein GCM10009678_91920 [Actinomadura kijaniata]|uniref:DUF4419 domain-containing protein n=1 Tax=Actinomadura kijaniata TaxID=46161 RepID=UPI002FE8E338
MDDVVPAAEVLPTVPLGDLFPEAMVLGGDPALPVLQPDGVHPLLSAVGRAFADHRPLVLSPDAVWLTILQGLAQHVRLHAEELRPLLVSHAGRRRLSIEVDGPMPQDAGSWQFLGERFAKLLAGELDHAGLSAFECDFSTSTDVERTAGRIVLLDAYSPYFALHMSFVCGIPSVTLTGTVEDWRTIRQRVDMLAAFGLETWCRSLVPITDQFVRAATGDADIGFWQRVYSPVDAYGASRITGWITRLYPYLTRDGVSGQPNPMLHLPVGEPRDVPPDENGLYQGPGVASSQVPATLSQAIITITDRTEGDNRTVALHAGLTGVAQDQDGSLRPVAGWHLAPADVEIDDVIDRIADDHEAERATEPPNRSILWNAPADLVAVYHRLRYAALFDGAWRLRPIGGHQTVTGTDHWLQAVIDLNDGRTVCMVVGYEDDVFHWVVCRVEPDPEHPGRKLRVVDDPADVPVYGTSLAVLLDTALDTGGDITHLETGRLDQLKRPGN